MGMSEGYEKTVSSRLTKQIWWKKECHSFETVPRTVSDKLNKASSGVEVPKNKIENLFFCKK